MIRYFCVVALAYISPEFVHGVYQSRKLRTRLYPESEKAEEVMENYLARFEIDMSMPTVSPTSPLPVIPTSGPSSELTGTPTTSPTEESCKSFFAKKTRKLLLTMKAH